MPIRVLETMNAISAVTASVLRDRGRPRRTGPATITCSDWLPLAVADGLGFGRDVAAGAVVHRIRADPLEVVAAVRSADPLVDELTVERVGIGVVVPRRPVERDAETGIPAPCLRLEHLLETDPGEVGPELLCRLGQDPGADPAGLGDVVIAGVAPLESLRSEEHTS